MKVKLSREAVEEGGWKKQAQSMNLFRKQKGLPQRTVLPATLITALVIGGLLAVQADSLIILIFAAICGGIPLYGVFFVFGAYLWRNYLDRAMDLPVVFITS
ncbi:MAG: hypothetical protein AAF653_21795, partial [Chloroflexota bacterium]